MSIISSNFTYKHKSKDKNFKMATTEHFTQHRSCVSMGPVQLHGPKPKSQALSSVPSGQFHPDWIGARKLFCLDWEGPSVGGVLHGQRYGGGAAVRGCSVWTKEGLAATGMTWKPLLLATVIELCENRSWLLVVNLSILKSQGGLIISILSCPSPLWEKNIMRRSTLCLFLAMGRPDCLYIKNSWYFYSGYHVQGTTSYLRNAI